MNPHTYFGVKNSLKHFILNRLKAFCCFGMRRNENIIADNLNIVVTNTVLRLHSPLHYGLIIFPAHPKSALNLV